MGLKTAMYAVVWFQRFSLQSVIRTESFDSDTAIAVLRETAQRSTIYQVNRVAERHGIREGHTVSQALAKCIDLQVRPQKPLAEQSARNTLFSCLYGITPLIEETSSDTYTLQLSSIPKGKRREKINELAGSLKELGFFPQIGVAESPDWASYAAKSAKPLLWVEDKSLFFKEVNILTVVEDDKMREILTQWGIHTLGAFAELPQQAVGRRLGRAGLILWQSLHNRQDRILRIKSLPLQFEAKVELEHEVCTLEPLLFVLNRLIEQLCLQLCCAFLQAKVLILELEMDDKSQYRRVFKLPEATTHQEKLRQLLETHLENFQTSGAIVSAYLKAIPTDAKSHQNQLFQHSVKDSWKFTSTLHQLIGLVGSENVGTPKLNNSHLPDTFSIESLPQILEKEEPDQGTLFRSPKLRLQRFRPPLNALVDVQAGHPILLHSREINGSIQTYHGPWHQSGTWWDNRHWKRMEWDIELENESLYRVVYSEGKWFIDGAYG